MDIDLEAQRRPLLDNTAFDTLSEQVGDVIFDISVCNGKMWTFIQDKRLEQAVSIASDNREKFRTLKPDIERIERWTQVTPTQRFTQKKVVREFGRAFAEFQRIQKALAAEERKALHVQTDARSESLPIRSAIESRQADLIELNEQTQAQVLAFEEQLRQDEISYQQGLVQDREQEIREIEEGIRDLNEIFTNLSTVVLEQGAVVDNIEANIYSTAEATRDGARQLVKAAQWQRRTGGRQLCFLMILLVIASIIVLSLSLGS